MTRSREDFTVQVLRNGSGAPAGVGFVVDQMHIITCAHVVNTALGRRKLEQDPPDPGARIRVALPMLDGDEDASALSCMVRKWMPPPTSGVSGGDVAGLAVDGDELPGLARAAWLADYREFRDAEAKVFGYPGNPPRKEHGGWATVRVRGPVDRRMIQLDVASESAFLVQPGYSGSPVVVTDADGHDVVVAMLSAADADGAKDALAIRAASLAQAWPEIVARLPIEKCPYRGLEAFTADDVDVFAGRKDDVDRLRKMVRGRALTMVNGSSGVGKSSLVNAGLIPQLEAEGWATGTFRPGRDPVGVLARTVASLEVPDRTPMRSEIRDWKALIRSKGLGEAGAQLALALDRSIVLHVDQFEEALDPQICAPDVRAKFLELLLSAPSATDKGLHLVGTVRGDFMAQLLEHPDAGTRLAGGWFGLSPMSPERLEEVITEPARARGVRYEDGLAKVIARDAGNGSVLPLLEFALTQLWEHKRGPEISHAAYQAIGGVAGALSKYAENVYTKDLLEREQFPMERIRRVLLALVRIRNGPADATRRMVFQDRLGADWDIVQALARHRLVTIGRDKSKGAETAEIVHEALIREWPLLADWVEKDSSFQRWLTSAEERIADRDLLPDTRLAEADRWLADRSEDIPPEVQQLIQDSKSEWQRRITELQDARDRAEARRLSAAAELALATPGISLQIPTILAIEALKKAPVFEGDLAIRHSLQRAARPITRTDHENWVLDVAFSPDGTRIATATGNEGDVPGAVGVFDAATGSEIWHADHVGSVVAVVFSPDGTRIATASDNGPGDGGAARVFDAANGTEICHAHHEATVNAVVFSPDGTRIATATSNVYIEGHAEYKYEHESSARVLDAATGSEIWHADHVGSVNRVVFSPDGTRIATASDNGPGDGGAARVFDAANGTEICHAHHEATVNAVVFSPDGTRIAIGTDRKKPFEGNSSVGVFDAATGSEIWHAHYRGYVHAVVFSPDGAWIATASDDRRARVLDAASGTEVWHADHESWVVDVVFSPDGTRIATATSNLENANAAARVFDAATGAEICHADHEAGVRTVVFSPDGTCIATASLDHTARVFEAAGGAEVWHAHHEYEYGVHAVAFSPDCTRIATASSDRSLGIFDAATGTGIWHAHHGGSLRAVVFSPDGARIATANGSRVPATASSDRSVRVFDGATGSEIWHAHHEYDYGAQAVAFSPDGTRIATASSSQNRHGPGAVRVFAAVTGSRIWHADHDSAVNAVAFSPDGTRIATASGRGSPRVFDAATGIEVFHLDHTDDVLTRVHDLDVLAVAFSPDGTRIATAGRTPITSAGVVGMFDAATGTETWQADHEADVRAVVFSPDGTRIATASSNVVHRRGGARVFDAATGTEIWRTRREGAVSTVAFSPDGTRIAIAATKNLRETDTAVWVLDAATGTEVSYLGHADEAEVVVFSPDGTRVATASDYSTRVWWVDRGQLMEQAAGRLTRNLTRQEWSRYFGDESYRKTWDGLP